MPCLSCEKSGGAAKGCVLKLLLVLHTGSHHTDFSAAALETAIDFCSKRQSLQADSNEYIYNNIMLLCNSHIVVLRAAAPCTEKERPGSMVKRKNTNIPSPSVTCVSQVGNTSFKVGVMMRYVR
jgi:hypothetical protein